MRLWVALMAVAIAALCAVALSCGGDDDDNDDDDSGDAPDSCPGLDETTCLDYCLCQREMCAEEQPKDECDQAMCECADFHGCMIEDVVSEYDCQAVS